MVLVGRHSDRTGERKLHVAACALTAATGLVLAVAFRDNLWLLVLSFALSQMGQRSVHERVLGDAADVPRRRGGRRRHRADQRRRQPGRVLRAIDDGHATGGFAGGAAGGNSGQSQSRPISFSRSRMARKSQTWIALA